MDSTAKFEKWGALLVAFLLIVLPLVFSGQINSSFSLAEAAFFRIMTILLCVLLVIYFWRTKQYPDFKGFLFSPPGFLLVGFFAIQFLATVFSIAPLVSMFGNYYRQQGFLTQFHYLLFIGIFLCIGQLPSMKHRFVSSALLVISFSGILPALYGIFQKLGFDPFFDSWATGEFFGRVFSTLGQPNFLGQFLLLTLPASFALFLTNDTKKMKIFSLIAIFLQTTALLLTLSRSNMLGFWLFLFLLLLGLSWWYKKKIYASAVILIFLVLPLIFLFALPRLIDTKELPQGHLLSRFVVSGESLRSIKTRVLLWPSALKMFQERPILGQGPETFQLTFLKFQDPRLLTEEFYTGFSDRAHNILLDILASSGPLGLLVYLGFLIVLFVSLVKKIKKRDSEKQNTILLCLGAGLLGFLLADMFSFEIIPHSVFFWTNVVIIFSLFSFPLPTLLKFNENLMNLRAEKAGKVGFSFLFLLLTIFVVIDIYFWNIKPLFADYHYQKGLETAYPSSEKAREHFSKAAKIFPLEPLYLLTDGQHTLDAIKTSTESKEKTHLALKLNVTLAKLFQLTPENYEVYNLYAESLETLAEGLPDEVAPKTLDLAEWAFKKANELSPNSPVSLLDLADFHHRQRNYEKAVKVYERLLKISPPYWKWTTEELAQKSFYERERYRTFFINHPDFWEIFSSLSEAYTALNNEEKTKYYKKFVK